MRCWALADDELGASRFSRWNFCGPPKARVLAGHPCSDRDGELANQRWGGLSSTSATPPRRSLYQSSITEAFAAITDTNSNMFKILLLLGLWTLTATAQFGFFDQMFGGGQQQQQQANVRSDSSWYQAQYENGRFRSLPLSNTALSRHLTNTSQRNAHTTSAPAPFPAYTSLTTAPAHGRPPKTKSSWARVLQFVVAKAGGAMASLLRKWIWLGRGFFEVVWLAGFDRMG